MVMPAMAERHFQLKEDCNTGVWPLRTPGSDPMGPLAQAAFVHKNYGSALLKRFFLISGNSSQCLRGVDVNEDVR